MLSPTKLMPGQVVVLSIVYLHLHLHLFVQEKQEIHYSKTLTVERDTQGT